MFGFRIVSKKTYNEAIVEMQSAAKIIEEQDAKIKELQLKLYLQTLELKEANDEREKLIYNARDNHGRLIRNLNK